MSEIDPTQVIADALARMRGFSRPPNGGRPGAGNPDSRDQWQERGGPWGHGREGRGRESHRGGGRGERPGPGFDGGGRMRDGFDGFGADGAGLAPGSGLGSGPGGERRGAPALMRMLGVLARSASPLSVSDLGEAIGVDQPRASRLVAQAVELGYARREADPEDARRTRIALTDEGHAIADRMRSAQRDRVGAALEGFTEVERLQLAALLTRLADAWPA